MIEKHEDIEILLKTYFEAGVTPDCTDIPLQADALTGRFKLCYLLYLFEGTKLK